MRGSDKLSGRPVDPPTDDHVARLRVPPHSVECEQGLLGGLLLDNSVFDLVGAQLKDTDFYRYEHKLIYRAAVELITASKPADVLTVYDHLQQGKEVDAVGLVYLNALAQSVPSAANSEKYAEVVRECSVLRGMITLADNVAVRAYSRDGELSEMLDVAAAGFAELQEGSVQRLPQAIGDLVLGQIDRLNDIESGAGKVQAWSTGVAALDDILDGGFRPGQVITLAARPSVGKSSIANAIAIAFAKADLPVVFFSQEMPGDECAMRSLAQIGGIAMKRLKLGQLRDHEWAAFTDACERLRVLPLFYEDQPALTRGDIQAKAGAMRRKGPKLLVLDFIQECAGDGVKGETRDREITKIMQMLKTLAKRMGVAVLVISQLNRAVEKRADPKPTMSDLRESGSIEQSSDIVIFLWEIADHGNYRDVGVAVAKHRNGEKGDFVLAFETWCQRWSASGIKLGKPKKPAPGEPASAGPNPADDPTDI